MTTWLGPVFQAELVGTARRPRFFVGRVLYGLLVLFIVSTTYYQLSWIYRLRGSTIPIDELARFGTAIFLAFAWLQGVVFIVMTPSLVAGAIADEKQRKTLHYLMASQLSSLAIVLGKMGARLLRMVVLGLIGLPVLALVGLFGGIDYEVVALVYAATATTTFFLACLAILCSVYATKPRDAILHTFAIELIWFVAPTILIATVPVWNPSVRQVGEFCRPALEWVEAVSPLAMTRRLPMMRSPTALIEPVAWMMGLQLLYGVAMLLVAAWRLRPVYRNMDGPTLWVRVMRRGRGKSSRLRIFRRPPVGNDGMLWKELHVNRLSDARKIALSLICVGIVGFVVYAAWDEFSGAVGEALASYWDYARHQQVVNGFLRAANALGLVILLLGLGAVGASSITSEREGDTWTNLASSPIEGGELVRSKIWGALWVFRPVYATLAVCWVFGLLVGAVRPLGVIACLVELAVFTYFAASLATALSLRAKNTVQAMALTFVILVFCNGLYLFFLALLFRINTPVVMAGCTPALFTLSLIGGDELSTRRGGDTGELITACILGTIGYAIAAVVLQEVTVRAYDRIVDRPDRSRNTLTPEQLRLIQTKPLPGSGPSLT